MKDSMAEGFLSQVRAQLGRSQALSQPIRSHRFGETSRVVLSVNF